MDKTVVVAIIGGIAVVIAAVIAAIAGLLKKPNPEPKPHPGVHISDVKAGGDANIFTGDDAVFVQQQFLEDKFMSKQGTRIVIQAEKIIPDEKLRSSWSSFDVKFLSKCIKETPRGWAFDGEAFQAFRKPENDLMFGLGVRVYNESQRLIDDKTNSDYIAFNRLAQIYLEARFTLRQE